MVRRDQRGVTILELLLAMFLLAVALVGLAASFPYAMYGVTAGGFQTAATLLAQQSVDDAKNRLYSNLASAATGGAVCGPSSGTYATVTGFSAFTRCVSVETGVPTAGTSTVTVVVHFVGAVPIPIYDTTVVTIIAQ